MNRQVPTGWSERQRPQRLERRYEFPDYASLRDFLDRAAELSEREGLYPDLSFGRDYVNVTLHVEEGQAALSDRQRGFAAQLEQLQAQLALD
jgi:pterin-4a-carbinolamine dehydratase